jgi:hypothetical protein
MPPISAPRTVERMKRFALLLCSLLAVCGWSAAAASATTRYAAPAGTSSGSPCTLILRPCDLSTALGAAQSEDTISLANGSYDMLGKTLPAFPLHWLATDPPTRPVLTSNSPTATLSLTPEMSGTTFDHVEIDNTSGPVTQGLQPAAVKTGAPGVDFTVRSSVISGIRCIDALGGAVEIDDSTINGTMATTTCLTLGQKSRLLRSTVQIPSQGVLRETPPPPVAISLGLVEDSTVTGGLQLFPMSVARRVRAIGAIGIMGRGLVVDSFAEGFGARGAGIEVTASDGGTMRVIGSTVVGKNAPALFAPDVFVADTDPVVPNDLVVTDSIIRSNTTDLQAVPTLGCSPDNACTDGTIHIDHSLFNTRTPTAGRQLIFDGPGNRTGDPLFADPIRGDYHLMPGSPAIDAGVADASAAPLDLDGHARVQGGAPDLGAFETTTAGGGGPGGRGGSGPNAHPAARLSGLRLTPSRSHVDGRAKIHFTLDGAAKVKLTFQRLVGGHRKGRRCVSGKGHGEHCTILRSAGRFDVPHGKAGPNTILFLGRVNGKALRAGRYRLTATPVGGKARTVRLTVLP